MHPIKTAKTMVAVPAEMVQITLKSAQTQHYPTIRVRAEGQTQRDTREDQQAQQQAVGPRGSRDVAGGGAE